MKLGIEKMKEFQYYDDPFEDRANEIKKFVFGNWELRT